MGFFGSTKSSAGSAEDVKRVNEQLEERHYEFRSNCNDGNGDASACHSWGEWLAVVDKDYKGAADMYKLNCEKNAYGASCFNLGRLKLAGKGVEANDSDAFKLFGRNQHLDTGISAETSCKAGHAQGCHHLGLLYYNGVGCTKNPTKAMENFKEACERDDANSCNRVAALYLSTASSNPFPRDAVTAKTYLEKACDANFAPACHNLAVMYKQGDKGVEKDEAAYKKYKHKTNELVAQAGGIAGIKAT
ncbi:TPA: hypothetical protein N0F65_001423 [Lagenidium giganteum]|uniref:Uncharacterized protein n=1 Tax=Lagenidium giganteum TaxID=4803 RepID=A0AAV2YZU7_9STRA|nr:TPA: hypothetical protein N0F65_001423 [Lagenidium giganteum]